MNYSLDNLSGDIYGGITATAVALPAALAYGLVSGLGPAAGLYGAIAVGFFAGMFGGTRAQVSCPSAAMAVVTAVIVANHAASLTEALTIVVMGGCLQVLLGLSGVGRYAAHTPYMVISGFNSGIGVIIILIQLLPFLGSPVAPGGAVGALRRLPEALTQANVSSMAIFAATLAICLLWRRRLAKLMPPTVAGLILGTLLGVLWLREAPVIGPIPAGLPELHLPMPSVAMLVSSMEPAIILALFASMRTLITSLVADSFTGARHDPNRELVGQGIGNVAAGLIGGMPAAGATQLTVANILSGGRTRVSSVVPSLLILALMLGMAPLVEPIPLAVLAAILMRIGWRIIDWRLLVRAHRIPRRHLAVMMATMSLTVFIDLITAVAIGLIVAGLVRARQLEYLELDNVISVPLLDRTFFAGYAGYAGMAEAGPHTARGRPGGFAGTFHGGLFPGTGLGHRRRYPGSRSGHLRFFRHHLLEPFRSRGRRATSRHGRGYANRGCGDRSPGLRRQQPARSRCPAANTGGPARGHDGRRETCGGQPPRRLT